MVTKSVSHGETPAFETYVDLTVILPTLNEGHSIGTVLNALRSYAGCRILVVDDGSTDDTVAIVRGSANPQLRLIDRRDADVKGLTASLLAAAAAVETDYFVIMDADGQHPPDVIGRIYQLLRGGCPLVVASRRSVDPAWGPLRILISALGLRLGRLALAARGKHLAHADVLSGYFGARTGVWRRYADPGQDAGQFYPTGYKVLFDFLLLTPADFPVAEVGYDFQTRKADQSKIDLRIYWQFVKSCLRAFVGPR